MLVNQCKCLLVRVSTIGNKEKMRDELDVVLLKKYFIRNTIVSKQVFILVYGFVLFLESEPDVRN